MLPEDPGLPWERQPGESEQAWRAFKIYRDQPMAEATQAEVARKLVEDGVYARFEHVIRYLKRWSAQWSWASRREMWQAELDRRSREVDATVRTKMRERHATEAAAGIRVLGEPARLLIADINKRGDEVKEWWGQLSFKERFKLVVDCERVIGTVMDAEARARGDAPLVPMAPPLESPVPIMGEIERAKQVAEAMEQAGALPL